MTRSEWPDGIRVARVDGARERFQRGPELALALVVELRGLEGGGRVAGKRRRVFGELRRELLDAELVGVQGADRPRPPEQRHANHRPDTRQQHARGLLQPRIHPDIVDDEDVARGHRLVDDRGAGKFRYR